MDFFMGFFFFHFMGNSWGENLVVHGIANSKTSFCIISPGPFSHILSHIYNYLLIVLSPGHKWVHSGIYFYLWGKIYIMCDQTTNRYNNDNYNSFSKKNDITIKYTTNRCNYNNDIKQNIVLVTKAVKIILFHDISRRILKAT